MRSARTLTVLAIAPILLAPKPLLGASGTGVFSPPRTVTSALQQMSARAGVVFVGHVLAIHLPTDFVGSAQDAAEGVVEIVFGVDIPIRVPTPQSQGNNQTSNQRPDQFVLREWSGLWTGGTPRYRVGQRLLVMLHTPNAAGLSSPLDGTDGLVPLTGGDSPPSSAAGSLQVDLRWIEAKLLRQPVVSTPGHVAPQPDPLPPTPHPPTEPIQTPHRLAGNNLKPRDRPVDERGTELRTELGTELSTDLGTEMAGIRLGAQPSERAEESFNGNSTGRFTTDASDPLAVQPRTASTLEPTSAPPGQQLVPLPRPRQPWAPAPPLASDRPTAALSDVLKLLLSSAEAEPAVTSSSSGDQANDPR